MSAHLETFEVVQRTMREVYVCRKTTLNSWDLVQFRVCKKICQKWSCDHTELI